MLVVICSFSSSSQSWYGTISPSAHSILGTLKSTTLGTNLHSLQVTGSQASFPAQTWNKVSIRFSEEFLKVRSPRYCCKYYQRFHTKVVTSLCTLTGYYYTSIMNSKQCKEISFLGTFLCVQSMTRAPPIQALNCSVNIPQNTFELPHNRCSPLRANSFTIVYVVAVCIVSQLEKKKEMKKCTAFSHHFSFKGTVKRLFHTRLLRKALFPPLYGQSLWSKTWSRLQEKVVEICFLALN